MGYASLADLTTYGLIATALGPNGPSDQQKQAALDARSAFADTKLRARYLLPLQEPYDVTLVMSVVHLAAYDLMMMQGFAPQNVDKNIVDRAEQALRWLNDVERQAAHPAVIEAKSPSPAYPSPLVLSDPLQGWMPCNGRRSGVS